MEFSFCNTQYLTVFISIGYRYQLWKLVPQILTVCVNDSKGMRTTLRDILNSITTLINIPIRIYKNEPPSLTIDTESSGFTSDVSSFVLSAFLSVVGFFSAVLRFFSRFPSNIALFSLISFLAL